MLATGTACGLSNASAMSAIWSPEACPAVESPAAATMGAAEATWALAALASAARPMYSYDSARSCQSLSEPPCAARRAASLFVTSSNDPAVGEGCCAHLRVVGRLWSCRGVGWRDRVRRPQQEVDSQCNSDERQTRRHGDRERRNGRRGRLAVASPNAGRSRNQARTVTMMATATSTPARNQKESRGDIRPELSRRKIYGTVVTCVEVSVYASRFADAGKSANQFTLTSIRAVCVNRRLCRDDLKG